mgnify:CR=1 FL=1
MNVYKKGFTLIELLIVMAILGVLAVVVLVAINPVQQLARTRDAGRKSTVTQLGHSLEAYFTAHNGDYLDPTNCVADTGGPLATDWMGCLVFAGEMSSVPSTTVNSVGNMVPSTCVNPGLTGGLQNEICYNQAGSTAAVIYTVLESQAEESKCATFGANYAPFFLWSTADGRGGTMCLDIGTSAPAPVFRSRSR